ncbi:HAMP domain-containing histidine kinase (plasmid) [Vibrio sp. SS-MA-C1-2]|uniref:sensor histidine kinase n=1 Tax=Vibrio sp. SS-MA-C1-2 TaxID=2908646 RepID=UPI001F2C53B0|nr:HAMP domain-containing sensor histidine kinase [Vibrio sp. SS-MA-C1-2]UJF20363.1 HAMP domain-containing histidine kinase [Vibrio sp. SS-MA-C1-2]
MWLSVVKISLPRTLLGQLNTVFITGLLLSVLLVITLISSQFGNLLNQVNEKNTIERVEAVVDALDNSSSLIQVHILEAANGGGLSFTLDKEPIIKKTDKNNCNHKLSTLEKIFPNRRVYFTEDNIAIPLNSAPSHHMSMMHSSYNQGMHMMSSKLKEQSYYVGAIQLKNKDWLNFSSVINNNTKIWSYWTLAGLILILGLMLYGMYLIIKKALKPIYELGRSATKIGIEQQFIQIEEQGPKELHDTIHAFNLMQKRLDDYVSDRTRMVGAISHDLRTPLTSMRLRLEFIEESNDKRKLLSTLTNMEEMLNATLLFSQQSNKKEPLKVTDLSCYINTIIDEFPIEKNKISFSDIRKFDCSLPPVSLRRVIENLLNNACLYGKSEDGKAYISIQSDVDYSLNIFKVIIRDKGKGIPASQLDSVFKPFYRINKERNTENSNVGLGLSTSRSIILSYGGSLILKNHPDGLSAIIELPLLSTNSG